MMDCLRPAGPARLAPAPASVGIALGMISLGIPRAGFAQVGYRRSVRPLARANSVA